MEKMEDWRKAGRIAAEALEYGKGLIKKGASLLEVSDKIEAKIKQLGGECAFPVQISNDQIAAHYCAEPNDEIIFENQVACLDIGVHINGCIGDTACTVDLSEQNSELVKASEEALKNAIKTVRVGVTLAEIGKVIHDTITSYGFSPIKNLSGHGLSPYNVHDKPSVPNYDTGDKTELTKGQIIAIEPFATNGVGMIYETDKANIFSVIAKKPVRSIITRQVLKEIEKYNGLPFTTRWLTRKFPLFKVNFALKDLLNQGVITKYPPLPDKNNGLVSQAEHTLLVDERVEVLTRKE
jgi:methionyl aminopeptidase